MPHAPLTDELTDQIAATVEAGLWPRESAILHGAARGQWQSWSELGERLNEASAVAIVAGEPEEVLTAHEQACLDLVRKLILPRLTASRHGSAVGSPSAPRAAATDGWRSLHCSSAASRTSGESTPRSHRSEPETRAHSRTSSTRSANPIRAVPNR